MNRRVAIGCAAFVVALIVASSLLRDDAPTRSRKKAASARPHEGPRIESAALDVTPPLRPGELEVASKEDVARAVNASAVRTLVTNLKAAAVQGDATTQEAIVAGLARDRETSRSVLEEELARADLAPPVRTALVQALEGVR